MSRVPPKTCPRRGAAPAAVSLLFTTLAVGGIALPAVAATDATPAAKAKPHAQNAAPTAATKAVRSPYARAAAADAADRPQHGQTGRGQSTVQAKGHAHAKRSGGPTP